MDQFLAGGIVNKWATEILHEVPYQPLPVVLELEGLRLRFQQGMHTPVLFLTMVLFLVGGMEVQVG
jgi:hypothetical protein